MTRFLCVREGILLVFALFKPSRFEGVFCGGAGGEHDNKIISLSVPSWFCFIKLYTYIFLEIYPVDQDFEVQEESVFWMNRIISVGGQAVVHQVKGT